MRRNELCQYLNTSVINADTKQNFWKEAVSRTGTSAKNVEVQICRNYYQVFPLVKAVREAIPVQLERVDSDRKDCL